MIIRRIKLRNFQIYRDFEAEFSPMTFIWGRNGSGKTTLGLEAVMFCLWGYSSKTLTEIPTRGKATSCSVEVELEHGDDTYIIERGIPTFLKIMKNSEELQFENKTEAQFYLQKLFGEPLNFKKFRMIDNEVGVNFLDPKSAATFKRVIFSILEDQFNQAKENLAKIKQEREIWNKSNAVIYSHAPSERRLNVLQKGTQKLLSEQRELLNQDAQLANEQLKQNNSIGQIQGQIRNTESQKARMGASRCYACGQSLDPGKNRQILEQLDKTLADLNGQLKEAREILEETGEIRSQGQPALNHITVRLGKVAEFKTKLEGRLKQRNYIYTNEDVEIVKQAIKELDVITTSFLIKSIKNLEPIINQVLEKIQYHLEFDINDKGKFDMRLTNKDGEAFTYKDLSTGQKLMLQIAFKLALLLERGEEGLIIADEGLSALDNDNLLHILTIFDNYPFQLVFIIHHVNEIPSGIKIINLDEVTEHEKTQSMAEETVDDHSQEGHKI
jgi:DNA repair exonuclease SbcCD ATPase subunit